MDEKVREILSSSMWSDFTEDYWWNLSERAEDPALRLSCKDNARMCRHYEEYQAGIL